MLLAALVASFLFLATPSEAFNPNEYVKSLFQNYSSKVKPRKNLSEPVVVNTALHVTDLMEINERYQTMTFSGFFDFSWIDDYLIVAPEIETMILSVTDIWTPDIGMFNSVEDPQKMSDGSQLALYKGGKVIWFASKRYTVNCKINIRKYPFDIQKCKIRIGSWHSTTWNLILKAYSGGLVLDRFAENGQWQIYEYSVNSFTEDTFNITVVDFEISFKRRPLYALLNTVAPIILLSLLNTLTFRLPADSGEKIGLSISILLSFVVFLSLFTENMPEVSTDIAYVSLYLGVQLVMSVLSMVGCVHIWRAKYLYSLGYDATMRNANTSRDNSYTDDISEQKTKDRLNSFCSRHKTGSISDFQTNGPTGERKLEIDLPGTYDMKNENEIAEKYLKIIERADNVLFVISLSVSILSTAILFALLLGTQD